ncbi:MAG: anti-sigma factor domain-containing protein [Desulfitobacteriaceae bacterium]
MKSMKGVVLEKSGAMYTVLTTEGTFRKVHRFFGAEVGEELELMAGWDQLPRRELLTVWASVAALILLIFMATLNWGLGRATATVAVLSVDINPSLEMKLDSQNRVLDISSRNEDARRLLQGMEYAKRSGPEVLKQIVDRAISLHFLSQEHPWVLLGISSAGRTEGSDLAQFDLSGLADQVSTQGTGYGLSLNVAAFKLAPGEERMAQAQGLTAGEYALWLTTQKAGLPISARSMLDPLERARVLAEPQVQAQAEPSGGTFRINQAASPNQKNIERDSNQEHSTDSRSPESSASQKGIPVGKPENSPGINPWASAGKTTPTKEDIKEKTKETKENTKEDASQEHETGNQSKEIPSSQKSIPVVKPGNPPEAKPDEGARKGTDTGSELSKPKQPDSSPESKSLGDGEQEHDAEKGKY